MAAWVSVVYVWCSDCGMHINEGIIALAIAPCSKLPQHQVFDSSERRHDSALFGFLQDMAAEVFAKSERDQMRL